MSFMYGFIEKQHNFIRGNCLHACKYCYMAEKKRRMPEVFDVPPTINKTAFKSLGKGKFIFVGSSIDMFAADIPDQWISAGLAHCRKYDNQYLFQSKNPERFFDFWKEFPKQTTLCTTLESNRDYPAISMAPSISSRICGIELMKNRFFPVHITIEPILDFDFEEFALILNRIRPEQINIGFDTQKNSLPEPSRNKAFEFVYYLKSLKLNIYQKENF